MNEEYYKILGYISTQPEETQKKVIEFTETLDSMVREDFSAAMMAIALQGTKYDNVPKKKV